MRTNSWPDKERIKELKRALEFAQRNHHGQCVRQRIEANENKTPVWNLGHIGAHWTNCPAPSCKMAATSMRV